MIDRDATEKALVRLRRENALAVMRGSPGVFLAYASLRRSLRAQHALMHGLPTTIIVVTGGAAVTDSQRKAAELLATAALETRKRYRGYPTTLVRVLAVRDRRKSNAVDLIFAELGKYEVAVFLVRSRSEIPVELALAADAIAELAKPTADHVHAVRRVLKRAPIGESVVRSIVELDFPLLVAISTRHRLSEADTVERLVLRNLDATNDGPRIEELPGYTSAKAWAEGFTADVRRFRSGEIDWSNLPRGVLLFGPPGTGKTLFAQALARSADLPIVSASVSKWQAAGALSDFLRAMDETFETARSKQPSIVFLDELDSIGDRRRFSGDYVEYHRQVVNHLLDKIDGAEGRNRILVVAATNFREAIDPALLRGGRIETHIEIDLPSPAERTEILQFHLADGDDELSEVAAGLEGWSGADLERLAREAKSKARTKSRPVRVMDLLESLPPQRTLSDEQARRVAVHEAGHALVATVLAPDSRPSLSMRRQFHDHPSNEAASLGWTSHEKSGDTLLPTKRDLEDNICRILAGAAAEEVGAGSRSSGFAGTAGSDLDVATAIAARMVASYGMGRRLTFTSSAHEIDAKTAARLPIDIRKEIGEILEQQLSRAKSIVSDNVMFLEKLAEELLAKGKVGADDVRAIARSFVSLKS
ncbi:AAA family ATPase [Rhizobium leguminosarum]|uniref:AAA family ATPase n=1 Tax=Rhizobium leguminosarum TaxID=384 RepID=UPI001031BA50|nr:AAA family ATPase [Rhizobium leguminosarum]TAY99663.1 AAA family ATPase [Rhizobium leguminosarum]TAZ10533.1 AAA family ATPase [Rhizobium leguminosarum]